MGGTYFQSKLFVKQNNGSSFIAGKNTQVSDEEYNIDLSNHNYVPLKRMKTTFGLPARRKKATKTQIGEIKELDRDDHDSSSAFSNDVASDEIYDNDENQSKSKKDVTN